MKRPVIAYKCLPMRSPLVLTFVIGLAMDHWQAPWQLLIVVIVFLAALWFTWIVDVVSREELDVFRNR